jgi:geranylgeranyl pyrophosphate synthase
MRRSVLNIAQIFESIQPDLARVEAKLRQPLPQEHEILTATIEHLLSSGGKRIRPALVLLASRFYPADSDKVVALAASVEMLHTATLVHDDVIDGALFRRGAPTLNSAWTPSLTILTGDYLFARAAYMAAQTNSVRITTIFAQTLMTICTGEIKQQLEKPDRSLEAYYKRIYAKTAALLMASTEAAGVLSGAPEEHIQALSDYGHYLGMAFQVVDDVLDFTSDEATLGKPVGSDLAQGLATLPTLYYLKQHPSDNVAKVLDGTANDPEAIERAVQAVRQSEAIGQALAKAQEFVGRSQEALTRLPNGSACESLQALSEFVVQRKV